MVINQMLLISALKNENNIINVILLYFFFFHISSGTGESLFPYTAIIPFKDVTASNSLSLHFQAISAFIDN